MVDAEVTDALELELVAFLSVFCQERFNLSVFNHLERFRVEQVAEIVLGVGTWVLNGEQTVVNAHFCIFAVASRYPVECALHLAVSTFHTAEGVGVVGALNLGDIAVGIFSAASAHDDVGTFQAHLLARSHAEELLRSVFHKVVALDEDFAAERHLVSASVFLLRVVVHLHHLHLVFRIVGDYHLHRVEHGAHTVSLLVEVFTN